MRVIPPLEITPSRLTSSSATEPWAPAAYDAGTTYALGDVRLVAADFMIYESLAAANLANTPNVSPTWWRPVSPTETAYNAATTYPVAETVSSGHRVYESLQASNIAHTPLISPTWWLDVGPTNRYAMFDFLRNTQTVWASPLTIVLTPGLRVNSIWLGGVVADSITISMVGGGGSPLGQVYTDTQDMSTREVLDWYDYFFEPFSTAASVARFDIPPYSDGVITVTLTSTSGNVRLGAFVIGTFVYLGETVYNAESDVLNFSSVERDATSEISVMIPRRNVPKTTQTVWCEKGRVNKMLTLRDDLNATPAYWSWLDDTSDGYAAAGEILGFYRQFSIDVASPMHATIALQLEEI